MKLALKLAGIYAVMIILFLSGLFLVHLIPKEAIDSNIKQSLETLEKEGVYPQVLNFKLFQLDNYTDALMFNIAASADTESPVDAALLNYWHTSGVGRAIITDTEAYLDQTDESLEKRMYGRYWHGYLSILRPLLTVMDYSMIRIVNYFLLTALLLINLILIVKRFNVNIMLAFLLALLLIGMPMIPLSLQFSTNIYIALCANILLLRNKSTALQGHSYIVLFFIIGGVTGFFDLFTTPLITLGIPLTFLILLNDQRNRYKEIIFVSITWGVGYAAIWSSKWLYGSMITGENIFYSAFNYIEIRSSSAYSGMDMTIPQIVTYSFEMLQQLNLINVLIILIALIAGMYYLVVKSWKSVKDNAYFLLIAVMVPTWYLLLRNHSIQHGWFTWRTMIVTFFAMFIFIMNTTDLRNISKRLKFRGSLQRQSHSKR